MRDAPFIAVGGGLAGAAFALELARNGAPVLVLESTRAAHHKVCGEFLSAEAQTLIAYLGLDLKAMGATSVATFRLATGDIHAEAPQPFRGAGLSRYRLDEALLQAAEDAGAEVQRSVAVSHIEPAEGRVTLKAGPNIGSRSRPRSCRRQYSRHQTSAVGQRPQAAARHPESREAGA